MDQWRKRTPSAFDRAVVARARGQRPDPADLEEARRSQKPEEPLWVRRVAARVTGGEQPQVKEEARPMSEFEKRIRRRLGYEVQDDTTPAA